MQEPPDRPQTKQCKSPNCARAGEDLPLDEFYKAEFGTGRRAQCKACVKAVINAARGRRRQKAGAQADHPTAAPTAAPTAWPSVAAFDAEDDVSDLDPREVERRQREADKETEYFEARDRRRNSDFNAMHPADFADEFATGVANDDSPAAKALSAKASREKRQEFNEQMGEFAQDLRDATVKSSMDGSAISDNIPARHAPYVTMLAEQERRFGNRRWARSISIAEAHEQLSRQQMIHVAETCFRDKIEPAGYARFPRPDAPTKRTACVLLSDIHLGSELDSLDEPVTYRATEEARRLEYVLRQFVDYKSQYREHTTALVILNGDIIEGNLQHDLRAGSPLAEQKAIFWEYFVRFIAHVAECYPSVHVECQPGNHGRDKLRHPGRATSSKWDGHEWTMYYALKMMCSGLKNVTWSIPFRQIGIVDLYGSKLGVTHADTELKLGDPDTKSKDNAAALDKVNSTRIYGVELDAWVFGHYHKGRYQPRSPRVLWNPALVPPNGHARTSGYIGEPCGQWIWEAVEGYPIGDVRLVEVGLAQDRDERLGTLIKPFRFSMLEAA